MQVEDIEMWKTRPKDFIQWEKWNLTSGTRNTDNNEQLLVKFNFQEKFTPRRNSVQMIKVCFLANGNLCNFWLDSLAMLQFLFVFQFQTTGHTQSILRREEMEFTLQKWDRKRISYRIFAFFILLQRNQSHLIFYIYGHKDRSPVA